MCLLTFIIFFSQSLFIFYLLFILSHLSWLYTLYMFSLNFDCDFFLFLIHYYQISRYSRRRETKVDARERTWKEKEVRAHSISYMAIEKREKRERKESWLVCVCVRDHRLVTIVTFSPAVLWQRSVDHPVVQYRVGRTFLVHISNVVQQWGYIWFTV